MCLTEIRPAHLHTNIFTKQCSVGGYSPCVNVDRDPWYFSGGCDVSDEEKERIIRESGLSGLFDRPDFQ
jgi:hypothetical protein